MDQLRFVDPYDRQTGFGKRLDIDAKQKSAIAKRVAEEFAGHGDLAMFVADGTTAAQTFRAMVRDTEHLIQFATNNLDVCIQYACVPETKPRMHEPVLIDGSLDQDANALFPRWEDGRDKEALKRYVDSCDVVVMGASFFTWDEGPRTRHYRRQTIRKEVLRSCQDKTLILLLTGSRFYSKDLQYVDEPAWEEWKEDRAVLRHLHVVTCVPEDVEDETNERDPLRSPVLRPGYNGADWAYVMQTDAIREAIKDRLIEIRTGDWSAPKLV